MLNIALFTLGTTPWMALGLICLAGAMFISFRQGMGFGHEACALLDNRDFVLPEDIQHMFLPVLAHRMVLSPEAKMKGLQAEQILLSVLKNIAVPVKL